MIAAKKTIIGSSKTKSGGKGQEQRVRRKVVYWENIGKVHDSTTGRRGKSSMTIIIDWYKNPKNFERWVGGDSATGEKKEVLLTEVRREMEKNGIHHRMNRDIRQKLTDIK